MGGMTTFHIAAFILGTLGFVLALLWQLASRPGRHLPREGYKDDELTIPGARIDQSDEYAVEGGAGGAEGEGGSPGYQDGADGGVGGAEGGSSGAGVGLSAPLLAAMAAAALAGFGGAGLVAGGVLDGAGTATWVVAIAGGIALGCLAFPVVRFVARSGEAK